LREGGILKVLIVEDEPVIRQSLCELVSHWGYVSDEAGNGELAWDLIQSNVYDLVLLDLNLPKVDGLSLCRRLRQKKGPQPLVLMLTARDAMVDNIRGLEEGADDYVVKPFDPALLKARVQALLRRAVRPLSDSLEWGDLLMNRDGRTAAYCSDDLHLTPKEHLILEELIKAGGRACSKDFLIQAAWGWAESPGEESVKTHVKNLRAKLATLGAPADFIETVYGVGFRLNRNYAA
jgi:DNA-binding response OmpR family regulator